MEKDEFTLDEKFVDVGDGHKLYSQIWGSKEAKTVIINLHGGPGGGTSNSHKYLFDPNIHRVIFFDQRGSGKSLPYGSLENNTTDHLIDDITKVANAYGVDRFVLTGGSWGSCLALLYAIKHPDKVLAMVLRGIFTGRKEEIEFMDSGGIASFYPDVWERFLLSIPKEHRSDPANYHTGRMFGEDKQAALESAMAYSLLESSLISIDDRPKMIDPETFDPIPITIECHYLVNHCFIPEGYIQANAAKLTMPIKLVQGRYDAVCPPMTAYELNKILPNSNLFWTIAGHSGSDRSNADMVKALLVDFI